MRGSRRYRILSEDFGLVRDRRQLWRLRQRNFGLNASAAAGLPRPSPGRWRGPDWRFRAAAYWLELVRQGVLDGGLLSGLELEEVDGVNRRELELVPLGELPLAHGFCPEAPVLVGSVPGRPAQAGA
jgi:hypothetical protein